MVVVFVVEDVLGFGAFRGLLGLGGFVGLFGDLRFYFGFFYMYRYFFYRFVV